jgi:uncharacterized protein YndB with AHSA1/START domain
MAYCRATIEVPRPIDEVFEYLADFSNAAKWDPGVISARKLTKGPIRPGTEFEIVSRFLGRDVRLRYRATQVDPPSRVVFEGEADALRLVDTISLEKSKKGTRMTYDATLALKGIFYLADLPLHLLFQRIGRQAIGGLEKALSGPQEGPARGSSRKS